MRHMVAAACFAALRGPSPPAAACLHELAEMARVLDLHEWTGRPTKRSLATAKHNAILKDAPSFRSAANASFGRANWVALSSTQLPLPWLVASGWLLPLAGVLDLADPTLPSRLPLLGR